MSLRVGLNAHVFKMPELILFFFSHFIALFVVSTKYPCGAVVQRVARWTCDQRVVGSNPTQGKAA